MPEARPAAYPKGVWRAVLESTVLESGGPFWRAQSRFPAAILILAVRMLPAVLSEVPGILIIWERK